MKIFQILFFCFCSIAVFAQAIEKGSGIAYTDGVPTHTPNTDYHTEIAIDFTTGLWYEYSRDDLAWVAAGFRIQKLAGGSPPSGAPADKHSEIVLNDDEELFRWDGAAWVQINSFYTAGAGISIVGGVISNTGDLSSTNELQTFGHSGTTTYTNTLSNSGGSFTISAGSNISISHNGSGGVTITGTGDPSITNELQTFAHSGTTSYTNTLSNGGGSFTISAGSNISISHNGSGGVTITGTGGAGDNWGTQVAQVTNSITGDGTVGSPLKLVNDAGSAGNLKYYGTNSSGTKGFFDLPSADGNGIYGADNSINTAGHTATIPTNPLTFNFTNTSAGVLPAIILKAGLSDDQNHVFRFQTTSGTTVGDIFQFNGEQFIFHGKQGSATVRATNAAATQSNSWNYSSAGMIDLPALASDPTVTESDFWYNTTSDRLKYRATSSVKTLATLDDITAGGQAAIQFKDEGTNIGTSGAVSTFDVVGLGAEATTVGNDLTLRIGGFNQVKTTTLVSATNTTPVNITNLTFPITNGRSYWWRAILRVQSQATTTAPEISYTAPASIEGSWTLLCPKTATHTYQNGTYQQNVSLTPSGLPIANTDYFMFLEGWFLAFASGTFQLRVAASNASAGVGVFQNSRLIWGEQ